MLVPEEKTPTDQEAVERTVASSRSETVPTPAKRLIEVLGRRIVVILAVGSFFGSVALCLIGIFYPTVIPSQTSRFFFCLLVAFLFSVFVFTLFPADFKLKGKKLSVPIVLVGPAALWIGLFLFLWNTLPGDDIAGKVFLPAEGKNELTYSTTWVLGWRPSQPVYYKLRSLQHQNSFDSNVPAGFYVQFDSAHDAYTAEIGIGPSSDEILERYEVVFFRGASTYSPISVTPGRQP